MTIEEERWLMLQHQVQKTTPPPCPRPGERRREPRSPVRIEVDLETSDGLAFVGQTLDMSPNGCCLEVGAPLRAGDKVLLRFWLPGGGRPVSAEGSVIWARDLASGLQAAGLSLGAMSPGDAAALRQFLERQG